ncbi:MAG: chorismate synthase, partial [Bdellovibrionales bacterium]|nr:chorismate synthase [Bdellovibrionales bacterium]
GVSFDEALLLRELQRRRPGQSKVVSGRNESDQPTVLSGVFEGKTLGTPIAIIVKNQDAKSEDYKEIQYQARLGHADDVWKQKFGHVDYRGGGRASGRETVARVMAGAVAQMLVRALVPEIQVMGFASQIGPFELSDKDIQNLLNSNFESQMIDQYSSRFPGVEHKKVEELLVGAKTEGQSIGGTIEIWIKNSPSGLGQPVFHKIKSDFAQAFMSIGATSGFEMGDGQSATQKEGAKYHGEQEADYGGVRGGITTGEMIKMRGFFKPTSSILDVAKKGRHDPCIVPRAIPVVEAMIWIVLANHLLWKRLDQL